MLFEKPHLHGLFRGSRRCIWLRVVTEGSWRFISYTLHVKRSYH
ncbi:hypothetical protein CGRA01v4_05874 [Colletotrichum graminicola]|nr:hypothetical protein CGRA01v4_05874 [Colletotrichum graminicola]